MNRYGKKSILQIETKVKNNKTILSDSYFTSPLKILKPFYNNDNSMMKLCIINVSAGVLSGDDYSINVNMNKDSCLELYSQSYTKIFKMKNECAYQKIDVNMEENCTLAYMLKPLMPFKESNFKQDMNIRMRKNCNLIFREIISCGRYKRNEIFDFDSFISKLKIFYNDKIVFMDNTFLKPEEQEIKSIGLYGEYTHQANMIIIGKRVDEKLRIKYMSILKSYTNIEFGISLSFKFGMIIRILGKNSEHLIEITDAIYKA
ncbi:urease accessory protein [Clostridium algifaecis]|uniref:Urease accessory protein UreD n=1 Tax=Clostridium algifaecis TaxID=1472040 RepID=A0ABS4KQN0_9CLOT|nr:urease accessory protein UreD [Clostridium algifaecis]MBP2032337.1 urease accessory protein [Clostridium algifaecis]